MSKTRLSLAGLFGVMALQLMHLVAVGKDLEAGIVHSVLQRNCLECHGREGIQEAEVDLSGLASLFLRDEPTKMTEHLDLLTRLINVLEIEAMPPEGEPRLEPELRKEVLHHLRQTLLKSAQEHTYWPRTPIRRMNRFQYSNAVQDLLDLKVEVFALPERMLREHGNYFQPASRKMPENLKAGSRPLGKSQLINERLEGVAPFPQDLRAEHGFDTQADHLTLSPLLLESFLSLSRSVVESVDFGESTCGIWDDFFEPPGGLVLSKEIRDIVLIEVRERLRGFLTRAFRRPVDEQLLERYVTAVLKSIDCGESFTEAMKGAASAALASPRFLYIYDRANTHEPVEPADDFELASRLSFFLWGSIPDGILLDSAAQGKLRERAELERQVERMLNDQRMKRFCDSFPSQWLQLERIISAVPDPEQFPQFYFAKYRVSMHMMLEPLLVFETILIEDRSILELIDSDFSYRSPLLESWYIDGKQTTNGPPTQVPFQRVAIKDRRQGGVITTAAAMTMTSGPLETKPITRGAWLATVLFNDPPKPPPADVPPLPNIDDGSKAELTLRERLAAHREQAQCAGCHERIDPLGFALENYGPTGAWRHTYSNGRQVDSAGVLFQRHHFQDIIEFKDAILAEKEKFARAFTEHLLSFALGREIEASDWASVETIVQNSANTNFQLRRLLKQVVLSESFLVKSNPLQPQVGSLLNN